MVTTRDGITGVTRGPRDLAIPPSTPDGEQWIYQLGIPFQLSPTEAGMFCNIRVGGSRIIDLEASSDLILFDDLNRITAERAVSLNRHRQIDHPRTGERIYLSAMPMLGGFVPLGAKRADGSPHPHAGTGYGLSHYIGVPVALEQKADAHWDFQSDIFMSLVLQQYEYDGKSFRITRAGEIAENELLPGWNVLSHSLSPAIASGDDLISGISTGRINAWDSGFVRWQRGADGCWRPVQYQRIVSDTLEPSLIRDVDGSLLMLFRPWYGTNKEVDHLRIYRSRDEGATWEVILTEKPFWQGCPMTLNRAADGTPYMVLNRYREPAMNPHAKREMLWLWPLSNDRHSLLDPIVVRDGTTEWGPTPNGSVWRLDHPVGATVRLKEGKWHHVLAYRVLDDAEMRTDAGATPMTGCYVEEIFSAGEPTPTWLF